MKILSVSAELAPWCKTGGLGDVAAALPDAITAEAADCTVIRLVPLYREAKVNIVKAGLELERLDLIRTIELVGRTWNLNFWALKNVAGAKTIFVEAEGLFDTEGLYDEVNINGHVYDNDVRFGALNYAALEAGDALLGGRVDVFHVHDWHVGLLPLLLKEKYLSRYPKACTVMTIHNLAYQGWYPAGRLPEYPIENDRPIHFLALGIEHADRVTTVSPRYAEEIQTSEFGCAQEDLLKRRGVLGILNGVDLEVWNPKTDIFLAQHFSAQELAPKRDVKSSLMVEMGIEPSDGPLLGIVSRFDPQKGLDLVLEIVSQLAEQNIQLCVLGSGSPQIEASFRELAEQYPKTLGLKVGFDNGLAHRIFAGTDMMLIPSRFEPCGLTQLYAMRYGSIPVASAVGGLCDTIDEVHLLENVYESGSGYLFTPPSAQNLLASIKKATELYVHHAEQWQTLVTQVMSLDFSWSVSARAYVACYSKTLQEQKS